MTQVSRDEQPEITSFSQATRDGRCLEVWFKHNVDNADRAWLLAAINEKIARAAPAQRSVQERLAEINISIIESDKAYAADILEDIEGEIDAGEEQVVKRALEQWVCKIRVETLLCAKRESQEESGQATVVALPVIRVEPYEVEE